MQVKLSKHTVDLKDELNWGEHEEIQAELMGALRLSAADRAVIEAKAREAKANGTKLGESDIDLASIGMDGKALLAAKYKSAEVTITKIVQDSDGTEIAYSNSWLRNISVSDGMLLQTNIELVKNGMAIPKV